NARITRRAANPPGMCSGRPLALSHTWLDEPIHCHWIACFASQELGGPFVGPAISGSLSTPSVEGQAPTAITARGRRAIRRGGTTHFPLDNPGQGERLSVAGAGQILRQKLARARHSWLRAETEKIGSSPGIATPGRLQVARKTRCRVTPAPRGLAMRM